MRKILSVIFLIVLSISLSAQYNEIYKTGEKIKFNNIRTASNQTALMDKYDVKFYKIDIKAERNTTYIEGNTTINAIAKSPALDTIAFELKNYLIIDSVLINNQKKNFIRISDDVLVKINPINQNTFFSIQVYYRGINNNPGGFFNGISSQVDPNWGNEVTWTLSEPFAAKEWFPVKQSLSDKADSAYIFITTSAENKAGSNGLLTNTVFLPNNKVRYEWKCRYPIAYYLISIAVGKYIDYSFYAHPSGLQDSILIQNYIYDNPNTLAFYKNEIDRTKDFIELYSDLFGIYPYYKEKYGHSLAPLGGGMEHQTMTTQGDFNFYLTCHELAHQWWGNNVTCATWSDIWINEGFASYCEYIANEHLSSSQQAKDHMEYFHTSVMSSPDGSVYIPPVYTDNVWRIFDGRLSYHKGAAILHNLRFEAGSDSLFFETLKQTQNIFKDSVLTGIDFKNIAEQVCGKNFSDFFDQWYFGEGYPTFNIIYWKQNDTLTMQINQTTSAPVTNLFKMNMEYKILFPSGDTIIKLYHSANNEVFKIPFKKEVTGLVVDPNNWVINGNGNIIAINESDNKFSVYPNPCIDYLQIYSANRKSLNITLTDISGKTVINASINPEDKKIDVSKLEKGLYLLKISDGKNNTVKKIIKQ